MVEEVGMIAAHAKCTKLYAPIARKNVKSHLNPEKIVRFIAGIVFQSIKMAAVNFLSCFVGLQKPASVLLAGFSMEGI